jgi:SAM-dependent methyltransferase
MHKETRKYMREAFRRHVSDRAPGKVLDVGASGKRAWFREIWETGGWSYEGMDLAEGPHVTHVLDDPWKFPIENDSFDAVISGNMFEHNEFFWLTLLEMARVLKMGGVMVHLMPSRGIEHRDPQDCWRFYRDGMEAMAKWAGLDCIEATTDWAPEHFAYLDQHTKHKRRAAALRRTMRTEGTDWGDTVGVFVKTQETGASLGLDYIRYFFELHGDARGAQAAE